MAAVVPWLLGKHLGSGRTLSCWNNSNTRVCQVCQEAMHQENSWELHWLSRLKFEDHQELPNFLPQTWTWCKWSPQSRWCTTARGSQCFAFGEDYQPCFFLEVYLLAILGKNALLPWGCMPCCQGRCMPCCQGGCMPCYLWGCMPCHSEKFLAWLPWGQF